MGETEAFSQKSAESLKLLTRGRKSSLPHIAVLRFVFSQGVFFVVSGTQRSDWALNAIAAREATIRIGDSSRVVKCETSAKREEVLMLFAQKYGRRVVADWYADSGICLKLTPIGQPTARGRIRGENESSLDFKSWKETGVGYYSAVSEAFDSASEEYDFTIRQNFINVWIRDRSIEVLLSLARPEDVLLEIGSGTGAEALIISKHVHGVVATDISGKMISLLERKVESRGLTGKVKPIRLGASEIGRASDSLPKGKVRLAYSLNGALNCELKIRQFPYELWKIMEPEGLFVCSIRNTLCLSEALTHAAVLQFSQMAPRKRQPVMVSVGGMDIPSYYYSPGKFAKMFEPYFTVKKMVGLPALIPPAYLSAIYVRLRKVLSFIERAEYALASYYPLNRLGDQTLLVFERREIES
ncbi:MAG TPA: methyltransferase domain-containing protein [Nitrososphaerales archaeon]|nr:methyltransferase domain-containing protein [Nitrososphaerales archaeon]